MCKASYADRDAQCPYYRARDGTSVRCEGYTEGMSVSIRFLNSDKLKTWTKAHCDSLYGYRNCPLQEGRDESIEADDLNCWNDIVKHLKK